MQPPPHLLLELLLLHLEGNSEGKQQLQQQYGLDDEQMEGLSFLMAADESFAWMYKIAQQVQQQQHACSQQNNVCECVSSISEEPTEAKPAAAAAAAVVWQQLGQVHQQQEQHPRTAALLQQLPPATDAASLAANLVQLLAEGSICQGSSSSQAIDNSIYKQVVQQLRVLGGALVLRFVAAARAAGGVAWRQEVPLQAVLLLGAVEQLQGLVLDCLQHSDVVTAAAEATSSSGTTLQQQQQQQHAADALSSDDSCASNHEAADFAAVGSAAAVPVKHSSSCSDDSLLRMLGKVQELLQMIRQFREANEAINAVAQANPKDPAVAARPCLSDPPQQGLAANGLFSAASRLLQRFPEPCGYGIWAPCVPPAAGAAAAAAKAQAVQSSRAGSGSWADAAASSSSYGYGSKSGSEQLDGLVLAALAGAGALAQRGHSVLDSLCGSATGGGLQDKLVQEVLRLLQGFSRGQAFPEDWQQLPQQALPEDLQRVQRVCQQHGFQVPHQTLVHLRWMSKAVLSVADTYWKHAADAAGINLQRSSSLLHGYSIHSRAVRGAAAIRKGQTALWYVGRSWRFLCC
jgi:hypothetical protein